MFRNLNTQGMRISNQGSEAIELALTHGFKGIDVDILEFKEQVEKKGFDGARRLLKSAKLKFGSFRLPIELTTKPGAFKSELINLADIAKLAAELGCKRSVLSLVPFHDELPYHENFEQHRERLNEIAGVLEPHEIRLGLEFHAPKNLREGKAFEFLANLDSVLTLIQMVGSSNVGLCLDPWQIYVGGGDLEKIRGLPVEQIVCVQLADAPADQPADSLQEKDRLLPGETGTVDLVGTLRMLQEMEYDGPITPAPDWSHLRGKRLESLVRDMGSALDRLCAEAKSSDAPRSELYEPSA